MHDQAHDARAVAPRCLLLEMQLQGVAVRVADVLSL